MTFHAALHMLMTAASQEAENVLHQTLKHDLVLFMPDDPKSPAIRFGVGDHDWRHAWYQEPGQEAELLPIAEVAKRFSHYALGRQEPAAAPIVRPVASLPQLAQTLPAATQKGLPSP